MSLNAAGRGKIYETRSVYATFPPRMVFPTGKVSIVRRSAALSLVRLAGTAAGLADLLLSPREVQLLGENDSTGLEALVLRLVALGSELRVELRLGDGTTVWTHVSRAEAQQLELREGQILAVRLSGPFVRGPQQAPARA
jgi:hypothetical protein